MSPSNNPFPGMEHQRLGDDDPRRNVPADPTPAPNGPSRADRFDGLRLAVEAIRGRNFNTPGGSALAIAEDFAKFLHDGSRD